MTRKKHLLGDAHIYESLRAPKLHNTRPRFHFSSPVGWINDPNGFSRYNGLYHMFFQYYPYDVAWGPMHWGHAVSEDLVTWQYMPAVLSPDQDYDFGGCYSGSAIEDNGKHYLFYTGVVNAEDGTKNYHQVQCMAVGDGIHYDKYEHNPVIDITQTPADASKRDFRDPKVWKDHDTYYMVVGSTTLDGYGQVLMYESKDMVHWDFIRVLDKSHGEYGIMWECPDFFMLYGHPILMVSPQHMKPKGREFHAGDNVMFVHGDYDLVTHEFTRRHINCTDYGLDFYAATTLQDEDGSRIMIAWMESWANLMFNSKDGWMGMMTFPRELRIVKDHIYQFPVDSLKNYYTATYEYKDEQVQGLKEFEHIRGRWVDLTVTINDFDFHHFAIHFAKNDEYEMYLVYNHLEKTLMIDRTFSGIDQDITTTRKIDSEPLDGVYTLRLLLDTYSAEIFVNNGEKVLSNLFDTPIEADGIVFDCDGAATIDITLHEIGEEPVTKHKGKDMML